MPQVAYEQLPLFDLGVDMKHLRDVRSRLVSCKRSKATQDGYRSDFSIFETWCRSAGRVALPATADTLSLFLASQLDSGLRVATAERRLQSILFAHRSVGEKMVDAVECRRIISGARRQRKEKPAGKKALAVGDLVAVCKKLPATNAGVRDRALLVVGFASGLRRSELAALDLSDVHLTPRGVAIDVGYSKTDQVGKGRTIGVFAGKRASTDPVRTLREWIRRRGRAAGPLFCRVQTGDFVTDRRLTGESINELVQRAVASVGLDPKEYGAHSLRAGLVTAAAECGASDREIMRASGHKTTAVMQGYVRHARAFAVRNPLAGAL
jgi:site-specific recombinase XerD